MRSPRDRPLRQGPIPAASFDPRQAPGNPGSLTTGGVGESGHRPAPSGIEGGGATVSGFPDRIGGKVVESGEFDGGFGSRKVFSGGVGAPEEGIVVFVEKIGGHLEGII